MNDKPMENVMNWTVKGIKSWQGMDGVGTECTLYRDGVKVAKCLDEGRGGEMQFDFLDSRAGLVDITIMVMNYDTKNEEPHTYKGTPEEKLLAEYANAQIDGSGDGAIRKDMGWVVEELCNAVEAEKRLKNKTGFVLNKDGREVEYVMSVPYTPEVKAQLEQKHGKNLVRILNKSFVDAADAKAAQKKKEDARLRNLCKTQTVFRLKSGATMIFKKPYSITVKYSLVSRYGDELVEIINETLAA